MIGEGLVRLIYSATGYSGFGGTLPPNKQPPAYCWNIIDSSPNTHLLGVRGSGNATFQFDCFGNDADEVIRMGRAVDNALGGFSGVLTDSDHTFVSVVIPSNYNGPTLESAPRDFRVKLEYDIWFSQD